VSEPSPPSIQARDVTHRYGAGPDAVTAVDDVSLEVAAGELVAILGPSGSGKSTLLSILGGLLRPTGGEVVIGGTPLASLGSRSLTDFRARQIGFVFQTHNLVPYLTAIENLEVIGCLLAGNPGRPTVAERAGELLAELGIAGRADHLPAALSVGECQRVAIARALLNRPSVLLLDEPTASLDTVQGDDVVAMLAEQAAIRAVAVVMVTHDHRMAARTHRSLQLVDGRLAEADGGSLSP
jgi:putative ABC transport system ATP-binding protein